MSVELYNQHAAISDLQQTEEEVVDHHQKVNEFLMKFLPESRELYKQTNFVDYDQDGEYLDFRLNELSGCLPSFDVVGRTDFIILHFLV